MPTITKGSEYLVAFLHSAGTASATGMGLTGLSWQEIEAWVRCADMKDIVTSRDLKTIHTLSRVYAGEYARASQKGAKPPYAPAVEIEEIREVVSEKAENVFEAMLLGQGWD
jgi:hypothetical protein